MSSDSRPRLAVIGGGMGGVSTAYFCDADWTIDLFEARSYIGGSASTITVPDGEHEAIVDIGAETFNERTHPLYWRLLQDIDAIGAEQSAESVLVRMPGTIAVVDAAARRPRFVSTHPLRTPRYALDFYRFTRAARAFVAGDPSPELTVDDWVRQLALGDAFTEEVLLPWLASLTCGSVETSRRQSALGFLLPFARTFSDSPFGTAKTYGSRIGLGGILTLIVDRCTNLSVHTDARAVRVSKAHGAWFVETPAGRSGPYDKVVVNAPPHASRDFLTGIPDALGAILEEHEYYETRMLIHSDPECMPADRRDWCMHNTVVDGDSCEATIWLGAFRTNPVTGEPVRLFKSWASRRDVQPASILAEQVFQHPLPTPATLRAAKALEDWQGWEGLHFAGHFTTPTDLQETALGSGLAVARLLSPDSERIRSLERHESPAL